jgi:hypothetical protein
VYLSLYVGSTKLKLDSIPSKGKKSKFNMLKSLSNKHKSKSNINKVNNDNTTSSTSVIPTNLKQKHVIRFNLYLYI